jgi:hypothetical protein
MYLCNTTDDSSNMLEILELSKNNHSDNDKFTDFMRNASLGVGATIILLTFLCCFYWICKCCLYFCCIGCDKCSKR